MLKINTEVKGKDGMINFYVKSITASGEGKTTSTIEFIDGVNIIKGDSDTGKTKVISTILFAMGGSHKPFAEKTGYDLIRLVIGTPDGDISFTRKYSANLIEVVSHNSLIDSDTYTTQYNTSRTPINTVWLRLMGIEDQPELAFNARSVRRRMTWNNLMRIFYIAENDICRESSIIEPAQYTEKTLLLSAILYLVYGKDFADENARIDSAVREAKKLIMEEYLNKRLNTTDQQLDRLKAYSDALTDMRLQAEMKETTETLRAIEDQIASALEDSQKIADQMLSLQQKIRDMNVLANRYDSLQTQYESDIRRLGFVTEGEELLSGAEQEKYCPYCDSKIQGMRLPSYKKVSGAEARRIRQQSAGLIEIQKGVAEDKAKWESELAVLQEQYDKIERTIKEELNPKKTEYEKLLAEYQEEIDNRSQYKIYEQMRKEILIDLKEYITEEPAEKPKDYKPKEYFDADFCKSMDEYAMAILRDTKYPNLVDAVFDLKSFDVIINGGTKYDDHGKGYCAYINTVVALMFRRFLAEKAAYTPGITIIDSPLHGMFQGLEDDAPESIKSGLFRYFSQLTSEGQLIIAENVEHVPDLDYEGMGVRLIEFYKHDPGKRHGFLLDVHQ